MFKVHHHRICRPCSACAVAVVLLWLCGLSSAWCSEAWWRDHGVESIFYADVSVDATGSKNALKRAKETGRIRLHADPAWEVLSDGGGIAHVEGRLSVGAGQDGWCHDGAEVTLGAAFAGLEHVWLLPASFYGGRLCLPESLPTDLFENTRGYEWLLDGVRTTVDYSPYRLDLLAVQCVDVWRDVPADVLYWLNLTHSNLRSRWKEWMLFSGMAYVDDAGHPFYAGGQVCLQLGSEWELQIMCAGQSGDTDDGDDPYLAGMTSCTLDYADRTAARRMQLSGQLFGGDVHTQGKHDFVPLLPGYDMSDAFHPLRTNLQQLHAGVEQRAGMIWWTLDGAVFGQLHPRADVVSASPDESDRQWVTDGSARMIGWEVTAGIKYSMNEALLRCTLSCFTPGPAVSAYDETAWLLGMQLTMSY